MKHRWFIRALAAMLCSVMLLAAGSVPLFAAGAEDETAAQAEETAQQPAEEAAQAVAPEAQEAPAAEAVADAAAIESQGIFFDTLPEIRDDGKRTNLLDKLANYFTWFGYTADVNSQFVYNQKSAWQWIVGYNELFDSFAWLAFAYPDSTAVRFNYGGKEWLIKLWKGSYVFCCAIGGEIGVYNRPEWFPINHYFSAALPDMLHMEMTLYHNNGKLLTRKANDPQWWLTAYMPSLTTEMFNRPRKNVVMDATIELKDEGMRDAFVAALAEKGFNDYDSLGSAFAMGSLRVTDCYQLLDDGKSVRIMWQNYTDNWY